MVQFDKILETPIMETCVLIPEDFSLKIDPSYPLGGILSPYSFLGNLIPSIINPSPLSGEHGTPENGRRPPSSLLESQVRVCSSKKLLPQTRYLPFSGTVRTDKLPLMPYLPTLDVRHRLGSYDEIVDRSGKRVRLCNWVRFVRYEDSLNQRVNMVATRNRGSVMFDVIREIPEGEELVVFLLPETNPDDTLSLSTLAILRTSLYRRTLDSIMAEAPLDLSRSLVSSKHEEEEDEIAKEATKVLQGGRNVEDKIASSSEGLERGPPDPPFKRVTSDPGGPNPFLSSPFGSPGSLLPNYFPFGFPPHPLFPPSPFSLSRMPSIVSEGLFSMNKSPPSGSALSKVSTPSSPSPSCKELLPLRLQSPAPKRRERTMLPCSECGKAFDRPSLLKRHMRTHTGEKPHVCDVCGKGFSTSSSLNTHRRIHSGEKPHQCGICGKRFTASSNLYYHKMTHVKEKPHKCSLCTRSFPTPGDLRSHMFVHNGQWPHKCAVCGKGFSKLTNLRNHTLLHSGDRQPKRNFSLEQMERSADAGTDLPPSSSSSLFSSLSPPSTSSSPLHLLSPQSSSLLPFPAPLSKRGRGEEKGEREEEMEEEDEEVGVIDDDDDEDFEVEVGNKSSEREIVETPEKKLPETSAVDGEGYKKSPTAPSEIVTEPAVNAEKHDEILDRQNVQRFSADDSTASTSSLHYCSTSPTGVEHLPEPSDHLSLRFHTSKPLQAFGFPEAETSNDPLPLTSKGDERRGAP